MSKVIGCFILILICFQSCKNDDELVQPNEFLPPSNVKALSKDGSVTLFWTSQSSATAIRIIAIDADSSLVDSAQIEASITFYTIDSLMNGANYTFYLFSVKNNSELSNATLLSWGPTQKFSSVRVYEYESSQPPGLQFSTGTIYNLVNGSQQKIDVWLDGNGNIPLLLMNPAYFASPFRGWRDTKIVGTTANSLETQIPVPLLSVFDTVGVSIVNKKIYFAYTQDGHYVRFQVDSIGGIYPQRFVDVVYYYNSGYGEWAKR